MTSAEHTSWVCAQAQALGFDLCGVASLSPDGSAPAWPELAHLPEWLARGNAGELAYLHDPRRASHEKLLPGARSVIVCGLNYNPPAPHSTESLLGGRSFSSDIQPGKKHSALAAEGLADSPRGWISRYAWGVDYHEVMGAKLASLEAAMRARFNEPWDGKWYVDTGPIHERVAAHHAGLGWLGKHTLLISPEVGSWIFLGVLVTTLELEPSVAASSALPADLCGQCTLCIDACPTSAIVEPYVLDARLCISYLTIELRSAIPGQLRARMGNHVFGCDICQDVCPWNWKAPHTKEPAFTPREELIAPELEWLASLTEDEFRREFKGSPVKRTKWRGMVRNACVALGNSKPKHGSAAHARVTTLLTRLATSDDALIAEHATWALRKISSAHAGQPG